MQKIHNTLSEILQIQDWEIWWEENKLINARDLFKFLESKQDFSNWLKNRLTKYWFVENEDFLFNNFIEQKWRGWHNKKEVFLTLDTAKEISMVENNEKGRQARKYFLQVEKAYKQSFQVKLPQTYSEALRSLAEVAENNERLELIIKEVMPKANFAEQFLLKSGWEMNFKEWSDWLKIWFWYKTIFKILRFKGFLCQNNAPRENKSNNLRFRVIYSGFQIPDWPKINSWRTLITKKGIDYFTKEKLLDWKQEIPKNWKEPRALCEKKYKKILEPYL